jgi:hypothetical protein
MPGDRTHGYDLVLEVNDQVLNDNLPTELFPPVRNGAEADIGGYHFSIDYEVFFPRDAAAAPVQFDTSIPDGVVMTTGFSLNITDLDIDPGPRNLTPAINGTIRVHHALTAYDEGGYRCVGFDFATLPLDRVTVDITGASGLPVPEGTAERLIAWLVHRHLQNNVRRLAAFRMRLAADTNPFTPEALDVRVITDDCAALLVSTTSATAGNRAAFARSDIPAGANTVLMLSSRTLLMELLCPFVLDQLGLSGSVDTYFTYGDGAATLSRPADVSDLVDHALVDRITLTAMRFATGDDWLDATASLEIRGFGYLATGRLAGRVEVSMDADGHVTLRYSAEVADVELIVEPWVWLLLALGVGLLPTIGGIVAIVLPILPWILNPVLDAIASYLHVDGEMEREFPPFPIRIDAIMLDDLLCAGRAVTPPRRGAPRPDLWIEGSMEVTDSDIAGIEIRQIIGPVTETVIAISAAHEGRFTARTERVMFPIAYDWSLSGHAITGSGSIAVDGATLRHAVEDGTCVLSLDEGESFDGLLEVRARAADGTELTASTQVEAEGSRSIRSVQNAEVVAGPLPELMGVRSVRQTLPIDWPTPPFAAGQPFAVSAARNPVAELRAALRAGTRVDLPIDEFG